MKFHHIGVAVQSIHTSKETYQKLGYNCSDIIYDDKQEVNLCFVSKFDSPLIELVAPINESSPVYKILNKSGSTPYHTCYEVDDIHSSILDFKKLSFIQFTKVIQAIAFDNREICFLYNKNIGIIELLNAQI